MSDNDFMSLFFPEELVKKIEIREITPCAIEADGIKFIAQADNTLEKVLPIIFLAIPNAKYSEKIGCLTYKKEQRISTLFATGRLTMTHVKDRPLADKLVEELRGLINRSFSYYKMHGLPSPALAEVKNNLDARKLYQYLPRTDCKKCGEQGCYVFATKLFLGEKLPQDCIALAAPENSSLKNTLQGMLAPIKL